MSIIGLILTALAFGATVGDVNEFIDIPSIIIVVGGTIGMLIFGGSSLSTMFKGVYSSDDTVGKLTTAAKGWKMSRDYTLAWGGISTLIGGVLIRKYLEDPAALGLGTALAILTVLYAFVLSFAVYLPLQSRLEDRIKLVVP